jgi:hypothetical protein
MRTPHGGVGVNLIAYEHVDIPTLIKVRAARARELAPLPFRPRPGDVVEFEADDHVQQITLPSEA